MASAISAKAGSSALSGAADEVSPACDVSRREARELGRRGVLGREIGSGREVEEEWFMEVDSMVERMVGTLNEELRSWSSSMKVVVRKG